MAPSEFESRWIFGLHDPGGEQIMLNAQKPGWLVFTEALGHDPRNETGRDFRPYSSRGLGIICRLNNGYYPEGTLPYSSLYEQFAERCANFVAASPGCRIWIIGNEPNYSVEWPAWPRGDRPSVPRTRNGSRRAPTSRAARARRQGTSNRLRAWWWNLLAWLGRHGLGSGASGQMAAPDPDESVEVDLPVLRVLPDDPHLRGTQMRFRALHERHENGAVSGIAPQGDTAAYVDDAATPMVGEMISPWLYARCYLLCRTAIKRVPGHEQDVVLVAAPAPWNDQTRYRGNERGDWVTYFQDVLQYLGPEACDGLTLHAYTHGGSPEGITSEARMQSPFEDRCYEFRVYRDFLESVPLSMRSLPVYITEADQVGPWQDANSGWVQKAYAEIDEWNQFPGTQRIHGLILYRWPRFDRWYIDGKMGVIADWRAALQHDYRWDRTQPTPEAFEVGDRLTVRTYLNLRRSPGYVGKGLEDRIHDLIPGQILVIVLADSAQADGLIWWRVELENAAPKVGGWVAQYGPDGVALVERLGEENSPPGSLGYDAAADDASSPGSSNYDYEASKAPGIGPRYQRGDHVRTTTIVNARRTPGYVGKSPEDVVREIPLETKLLLVEGPSIADELVWWYVQEPAGSPFGWVAETTPAGALLLENVPVAPPTSPSVRFKPGDRATTIAFVRLRRTPGFMDKPEDDVLADIWQGTTVLILSGPRHVDDLTWWEVETQGITGETVRGWMAESAPGGIPLLGEYVNEDLTPFTPGDLGVVGMAAVRVRKTIGYQNKPDDDVIGEFAAHTTLYMLDGPRNADRLEWWRVSGVSRGDKLIGWVAQGADNGATLVGRAPKLPQTEIPDLQARTFLITPFRGDFGITQLWGENPAFYARYSYDDVALLGHNGIDFATPGGVPVLATAAGEVVTAGFEPGGFGNFILLAHPWGQSIYAHLDRNEVQAGQTVFAGAQIGITGNTGNSSGPHLHFAIRVHPFYRGDGWGGFSDPLPYLNPGDVHWPAYMLDTPPRSSPGDPASIVDRRPPPGMAEDAPDLKRP